MKAHASGLLLARLLVNGRARFEADGEIVEGSALGLERFEQRTDLIREVFVI